MHALRRGTHYAEALDRDFREIQEDFFMLTFYETQPKPKFGMVRHSVSVYPVRLTLKNAAPVSFRCCINEIAITDSVQGG